MVKNAVVTMCFGEFNKMAEITHPSIKAYADKIGADFVVIKEKKVSENFIHYEKFQIYDLFKKYNRLIYIDTDVIVRPDCPNLFEEVPEYKLGIFNEGRFGSYLPVVRDACVKYKISLEKWEGQSYNTGVMVLSRLHRKIFVKPEEEHDIIGGLAHYEQPYLNLKIISGGYLVEDIGYKFNRMSLMDKLTGENRLASYIIHYASAAPVKARMKLIEEDLRSWEETAPDYFYPKNIHVNVSGGLGDQIDAEPVVRFICNKMFKGDNIRVKTHFPRIFKHLPVRVATDSQIKKDPNIYYKIETLPSPETPLWQHLAQTLCHTTDFISISSLRRILPDIDKTIRLHTDFNDIKSLIDTIGIRDLTKYILVHPGKGWASKTFPAEFWQSIINRLAEEKLPVAVVGKVISEEQGLVDIECPENVLDLRNLLSLDELIALVSQAKILISNDSAPVHIAGAFDNWIVLIPSCKHPDHVVPYRYGIKYYKTLSLYKKLTCDAIDSSPTQVDGQTIDYVVGDIMDYLPDAEDVVQKAKVINSYTKDQCFFED